jgi:hypothetical protein
MKREMEQEGGKTGRFEDASAAVIGACIEVHRHLGPGLLENLRETALKNGLRRLDSFLRPSRLPVNLPQLADDSRDL